ncbi:MAG: bifunctional (p)ppGpp synthetase/guanosine-3',5'-bis(diphosphate) 3'-pyrophosphohydrolase [Chloroflexi bacterium]|nr:bifunctional (p)ppGpp synthetase/guanosine-3',5'-bis(diphosphate) 3'-pyrophosphohydrolase [Chloroflexota bacterium]
MTWQDSQLLLATPQDLDLEALIGRVKSYWPAADEGLLRRAYRLAEEAHKGQSRLSGEPYVSHPLATAWLLSELHMDPETIVAALLHDVPEDTATPLKKIQEEFGHDIASLVDGVTKLSRVAWESLEREEAESLRKMFLAMAEDIRVVLIKLADRLHNMRTLGFLPPEKQKKVAEETLEIFAPLANRLGIWQIKWELEDLALHYLDPQKYEEISGLLAEKRTSLEQYIARVIKILEEKLGEEGIRAEITGRPKHIYSIYRKMVAKERDFHQIYDVRAVRVTVDELKDCYAALGVVHSLWKPIPGEFDDYIATPKDNLYRSLHTAALGPEGKPLEIQIRTREMHQMAEYGIAAHWRYKEPGWRGKKDSTLEAKIAWLRQLMGWRQELVDAKEFVASLKTDLFPEQVYVFTPKGDIVELPSGSTPVDFAYHIHTQIGDRCRGAKVNGRLVSLDYKLQNGDQVEIITSKTGGPSRDWLNPHLGYVATSRAREKIRQWFKREAREENIAHGREILERELRRLGIDEISFEEMAKLFHYEKVDDFLAAIGYGDLSAQNIATRILEKEREKEEAEEETLPAAKPREAAITGIRVRGVGDLLTHMARCCTPLPGDEIIGYVTRGRGVTIHRRDCKNLLGKMERERLVEVDWGEDKKVYPVVIRVEAYDRKGLLKDIAEIVEQEDVNISSSSVTTSKKDRKAIFIATLEISGMSQLSRILTKIEGLTNVLEARRQAGG